MTSTATIDGTCRCGRPTSRERADGRFAEWLNALPLICDSCLEIEERAQAAEEAREAAALERRELERRVTISAMPDALRRLRFEALDGLDGLAVAAARAWSAGELAGLVLTGSFGVGKTWLAAAAALERMARGRQVAWRVAPLLMAQLGSGFGSPAHERAMQLLTEGRCALVLDDLDKTRPTAFGAEQIFLAVDHAVTNGRALLVTTNLSPAGLAANWPEPFGDAIVSRLLGYCRVVPVPGEDRRLRGPA